jgi:hypothetical protein
MVDWEVSADLAFTACLMVFSMMPPLSIYTMARQEIMRFHKQTMMRLHAALVAFPIVFELV